MSIVSEDVDDAPLVNYDTSKGSSISSGMQEEYNDLLKYAMVTPKWDIRTERDPSSLPQLRLLGPDNMPLTTVDEYSTETTDRSTDGRDSAVGSEEITSDRNPYRKPVRSTDTSLRFLVTTSTRPNREPAKPPVNTECRHVDHSSRFTSSATSTKTLKSSNESLTTDSDFSRVKEQLNFWCSKLNDMVLAEMSQTKAGIDEQYRKLLHEQQQEHHMQMQKLQDEMENMKELLHNYETSIARKDSVISNLTRALQTSKERVDMSRVMVQWKFRLIDQKRQTFTANLAKRYREHTLAVRAWQAWRSLVEGRWKEKVEKACQKKAQEVCEALISDYEATISSLNEALDKSRLEVQQLHDEREKYEEAMKKAFMRGVCALNLEAMTMFQDGDGNESPDFQNISAVVEALSTSARGNSSNTHQHQACLPSRAEPHSTKVSSHSNITPTFSTSRPLSTSNLQSVTRHSSRVQNGPDVTPSIPAMQDLPKKVTKKTKHTKSHNVKVTSASLREGPAPSTFSTNPSAVLVKRHHPNIQNHVTQKPLKHVVKYPNTPTRTITGKR